MMNKELRVLSREYRVLSAFASKVGRSVVLPMPRGGAAHLSLRDYFLR